MIDLHMHTNHSDGSLSTIELLKKAEKAKLEIISITDHDGCLAYDDLKKINIKEYYTGKIIPGVELDTAINGSGIEILGYNVDTGYMNRKIKEIYKTIAERNDIQLKRMYDVCIDIGIKLDKDVLERYDNSEIYSTTYLWKQIVKDEYNKKFIEDEESWKHILPFYRKHMTNPKDKFFYDTSDLTPTPEEVCNLIKEADGLVFIPHLFCFSNYQDVLEYLIKNCKVDGLECYYSYFTKEQEEYLVKYCKENNLLVSGGSDYHGEMKPGIEIGVGKGNLNISKEIIKDWKKTIYI